MRFKEMLAIFAFMIMLFPLGAQAGNGDKAPSEIYTDERVLPRDYESNLPVITVDPAILGAGDREWESIGDGAKRKVFFNDRLTMVLLKIDRPVKPDEKMTCHYHSHDQITYVVEGRLKVQVGEEKKEIGPGGCYVVPSNVHHGIVTLTPKVFIIDVFTPTREDFRPKD